MDEIHFAPKKPWLKPLLVGIYRGNQTIPGLLGWCRISSHPDVREDNKQLPGYSHETRENKLEIIGTTMY